MHLHEFVAYQQSFSMSISNGSSMASPWLHLLSPRIQYGFPAKLYSTQSNCQHSFFINQWCSQHTVGNPILSYTQLAFCFVSSTHSLDLSDAISFHMTCPITVYYLIYQNIDTFTPCQIFYLCCLRFYSIRYNTQVSFKIYLKNQEIRHQITK